MKRNVYLVLITIITVICIIAGTGYHLVRFGLSVAENLPSLGEFINAVSDQNDDENNSNHTKNGNQNAVSSVQTTLDAFTSISADMSVVDLTIKSGDTFSIAYKASKKLVPEYKVENNCLTITQHSIIHNAIGGKKCLVTVTVADALTNVKLQTNVGDVDLSGLTIQTLDLGADVGDIDLKDCSLGTSTLEADVGDVDLKNNTFQSMNISNNVGDVSVISQEALSDYSIDLNTSIGDVTVNGKSCHRSYSQDGKSAQSLTISNDTGDIDLKY